MNLYTALALSVDDGLCPGAAAAVVSLRTGHVERACVGTLSSSAERSSLEAPWPAVTRNTVYDLASLTKLLCTTVLVADDVAAGLIRLDEAPWSWWPGITVEHVLRHSSGLPAYRPFFEQLHQERKNGVLLGRRAGKALVVDAALRTMPEALPGERTLYSDIGFIALGALLEDRHDKALDALWLAHPLSADTGLRFVDLEQQGYHPALPAVAPTERCPWRKRIVQGQVHDDNAYCMGGVAGHAGLFGSLDDLVVVASRLLWRLRDPTDILHTFAKLPGTAGRPLGFDLATPGGSTADVLSTHTVGHLGFTGTSLWFDLETEVAYVLLANTVHYGREGIGGRNKALRQAFHRAAVEIG